MDDNALDIILRLQDELSPALAKAQAALRDAARQVADTGSAGSKSFKDMDDSAASWFATITGGVAAGDLLASSIKTIANEALNLAKALPELALRGAAIDDVSDAFDRLTSQIGRSGQALLTTLRAGTHGTISDFDLMKRANQDLAAGLNLTDDQFNLLAKGAFALAQATGGSVKDALDTMNDAMVTGRARAIAMLTGKIDLKAAEEAFAKSLGVTVDELSAEGKLQADRQAILGNVGKAVDRLGEQTDGLDEKVAQGEAHWRNYLDQLGQAIATSPVLIKALDGIAEVLTTAFGGDRETSIQGIVAGVNELTIRVIDLGLAGLQTANVVITGWDAMKVVVLGVETTIVGLVDALGELYLAAEKVALKLHLVDPSETAAMQANIDALRGMTAGLAAQTAEAARGVIGEDAFHKKLDEVGGSLFALRDKLEAAAAAHTSTSASVDKHAASQAGLGAATADTTELTKLSTAQLKAYDELLAHMDKETFTLAMEHEKQWREERLATMKLVNAAILAEFDAQTKLNAEWGLNAAGAVKVQSSALDVLSQKLAALHATRIEGISQEKQEQVLLDQYATTLYDVATAADAADIAFQNTIPKIHEIADGTAAADARFMGFKNTVQLTASSMDDLNSQLSHFYDQLAAQGPIGTIGTGGVGIPGSIGQPRVIGGIETRDSGGPVNAGQPYLIGTGAQPELFFPRSAGTMVPNGAGGDTNNIYVTAPLNADPVAFAKAINDALMARRRNTGQRD